MLRENVLRAQFTHDSSPDVVSEDDIQLIEHQNVKLDAHRLSQSVQLFDPLMQDSSVDPSTDEIADERRLSDLRSTDNVFSEVAITAQQVFILNIILSSGQASTMNKSLD